LLLSDHSVLTALPYHVNRRELVALGENGPYRLALPHAHGVIVEYFSTIDAALKRMMELECLLAAAQGFVSVPAGAK
jgi:hypothetical protein